MVHNRVHKFRHCDPILSKISPKHVSIPCFTGFILISQLISYPEDRGICYYEKLVIE
jgi:hypothetical protein